MLRIRSMITIMALDGLYVCPLGWLLRIVGYLARGLFLSFRFSGGYSLSEGLRVKSSSSKVDVDLLQGSDPVLPPD
jgi:hypothetical protein